LEWFDSDLDLRLTRVSSNPARACVEFARYLRSRTDWALCIESRPRARVPIVCFEDARTGVDVDVSFGGEDKSDDTAGGGHWFANCDQRFYDLVLLLKIYLRSRRLDKPFRGGLGSFRLSVLARHFLDTKRQHSSLADTLRSFLHFSLDFDFFRTELLATHPDKRRSLQVTYGNVDVAPLRRASLAALKALDDDPPPPATDDDKDHASSSSSSSSSSSADKKNNNNTLEDLFSPHLWASLHTRRRDKLRRARRLCQAQDQQRTPENTSTRKKHKRKHK